MYFILNTSVLEGINWGDLLNSRYKKRNVKKIGQ